MGDEKKVQIRSENDIMPQVPKTEEEEYGIVGFSRLSPIPVKKAGITDNKNLGGKDRSAFYITLICVFLIVGIWTIDFFFSKSFGSDQTETVIDLLKYVITASLSFFFGTSVKKSSESN